ncbi:MAG: ATP-binding protein [Actinomycetota bacterium]|nr:ATP-binding protein [Actinomycetota bacterium]
MRPPPAHRATTAHLQSLYPFVSSGGIDGSGPLLGRDLLGGPFTFDPWEMYSSGRITNPNLIVLGQLGRGKSTFVKILIWRQLAFGRQAWIIDPKGEYGPLARACRVEPLVLEPGGSTHLNPLDGTGPDTEAGGHGARRAADLVASLLVASLQRPLRPEERTAVDLAVRHLAHRPGARSRRPAPPVLPDLVDVLLRPTPEAAASVNTDVDGLARAGRDVALELRRMVFGDLAGMFDRPTTVRIDREAPLVVLDLSAVFASPALPLIMTCAAAWLQGVLAAADGVKRLVVMDEAWAILNDLAIARWCQANFKLSRSLGVANVVVVHRVSDLSAAGADGSAEEKLAAGLLADSETRVVFGQSPSEAAATGRTLALSRTEVDLIPTLPRGVALWRIGSRSHLVEHLLGRREQVLVDTDEAMRENPRQFPASGADFSGTEG